MTSPLAGDPHPPLLKGKTGTKIVISIDPGENPIALSAVTYDDADCPDHTFTIKSGAHSLILVFAEAVAGQVTALANGESFDGVDIPPLLAPYTVTGT